MLKAPQSSKALQQKPEPTAVHPAQATESHSTTKARMHTVRPLHLHGNHGTTLSPQQPLPHRAAQLYVCSAGADRHAGTESCTIYCVYHSIHHSTTFTTTHSNTLATILQILEAWLQRTNQSWLHEQPINIIMLATCRAARNVVLHTQPIAQTTNATTTTTFAGAHSSTTTTTLNVLAARLQSQSTTGKIRHTPAAWQTG